jgi:uncharacterized Zn finger protein
MKRIDVQNDVPITIAVNEPLYLYCCDCGLVHRIRIVVIHRGAVRIAMSRDNRRTAAERRKRQ